MSISILATTYLSTFFVANAANMDMYLIMIFDTATCKDFKWPCIHLYFKLLLSRKSPFKIPFAALVEPKSPSKIPFVALVEHGRGCELYGEGGGDAVTPCRKVGHQWGASGNHEF